MSSKISPHSRLTVSFTQCLCTCITQGPKFLAPKFPKYENIVLLSLRQLYPDQQQPDWDLVPVHVALVTGPQTPYQAGTRTSAHAFLPQQQEPTSATNSSAVNQVTHVFISSY